MPIVYEYERCPNCGTYRTSVDGILQKCAYCGDDEAMPVDPGDVP